MDYETHLGLDHRDQLVSIPHTVRTWHTIILGATGVGKSTLMENMIAQDIARGDGVLVLDPHGPLFETCIGLVPPHRTNDSCLFDPTDRDFPIAWNILDEPNPRMHAKIADGITITMKWLWPDSWGPRLENLLKFSLETLLATPQTSLYNILRVISDDDFRERCIANVTNQATLQFWRNEYATWSESERREARGPIMNKINAFLFYPEILNILGQQSSRLRLDTIMSERRIRLANLAKGATSESVAYLIGSMILARVLALGFDRLHKPKAALRPSMPPFHIYVDEAQKFAPKILQSILTDARKLNISLTLSTQSFSELDESLHTAIKTNAGTRVCFQLGPDDAEIFAPLLSREHQAFNPHTLTQLATGEAFVHMRGTRGSDSHHLYTYPSPAPRNNNAEAIRKQTRRAYSRPLEQVSHYLTRIASHHSGTKRRLKKLRRPTQDQQIFADLTGPIVNASRSTKVKKAVKKKSSQA